MGGGTFLDRLAAAGERAAARDRRRAAIERGVRLPVLVASAALALVAWWLSGWEMWPWLFGGVGGLVVMLLLGRGVPLAWRLSVPLTVVAVWLLTYVDPWWWVLLAGIAITGAAVVALVRLRLRERRWQTLGALALGVVMVVAGPLMLAVNAAERARQAQQELNEAHEQPVARILPRTPPSMVRFLVEQLGVISANPNNPQELNKACFVFALGAQAQVAAAFGTPDCPGAMRVLASKVRDRWDYLNKLWVPGQAAQPGPGGTIVVDACHLEFSSIFDDTPTPNPGPQLGVLTLAQQLGEGHLIVDYRPC